MNISLPLRAKAATSYATAAISGVGNVPNQILLGFLGSRISDTHFPLFLRLTPRYLPDSEEPLLLLVALPEYMVPMCVKICVESGIGRQFREAIYGGEFIEGWRRSCGRKCKPVVAELRRVKGFGCKPAWRWEGRISGLEERVLLQN